MEQPTTPERPLNKFDEGTKWIEDDNIVLSSKIDIVFQSRRYSCTLDNMMDDIAHLERVEKKHQKRIEDLEKQFMLMKVEVNKYGELKDKLELFTSWLELQKQPETNQDGDNNDSNGAT